MQTIIILLHYFCFLSDLKRYVTKQLHLIGITKQILVSARMNNRSYYSRNLLPLITGICFGLITYWQIYGKRYDGACDTKVHKLENQEFLTVKYQKKREDAATRSAPKTVKAKPSRFNYGYRPYFVYSELGFRKPVIVAVKTTEERLSTFGIAVNNTWSQGFQNVIFFTPYSKKETFHDKYVKKLNLNVVQLPDIVENTLDRDFSFRILQYMKEHFIHKYSWFVQTTDDTYINSINLVHFLQSLNSSSHVFIGKNIKQHGISTCDHHVGVILSRTTLMELVPQSCPRKENDFGLALSLCLHKNLKVECRESVGVSLFIFVLIVQPNISDTRWAAQFRNTQRVLTIYYNIYIIIISAINGNNFL